MKTKIFWSDIEKNQLAAEVAAIREKSGLGYLSAIERAQDNVLPAPRRRAITTLSMVPWLADAVELHKKLMKDQEAQAPAEPPEPAQDAPQSLTALLEDQLVAKTADVLKRVALELLEDQDIRAAVQAVLSQAWQSTADSAAGRAHDGANGTDGERSRLARVLVVGLLPAQEQDIRREFEDCFDIRFAKTAGSHQQLRMQSRGANFVFGMTGFVNHQDERQALSAAGSRYMRIEGGLTRLREALTHVYTTGSLPQKGYRAENLQPSSGPH